MDAQARLGRIQRRTVLTLALAQLFSGVGNGAALAIGSLLAVELSGNEELAGTSTMALSLAGALVALPLASLAARRGRRQALICGLLLAFLGAALMVLAPILRSYVLVLAGSALLGVGAAVNLQARFAAVDLARPEHRGRDLSFVVWSITIGAVAGPNLIKPGAELALALSLPETSGPFLFSMAGLAIGATLLFVGLRPDPLLVARSVAAGAGTAPVSSGSAVPRMLRGGSLGAGLAAVHRSPMAQLGLVTVVGAHLVMVAVMSMTPVHLQALDHASGLHHSDADTLAFIGFTISLHIAGMYALSPVIGLLTDRLGRPRMIMAAQLVLLAAVGLAGIGHGDQLWVGAGLAVLGVGWSAATIAGSTLLTESVSDEDRVLVQGVSDTCMGAAGALGAALSCVALAFFGFAGLNLAAALAAAVVLVFAVVEAARNRGTQ
ncbi:MFS transporter [Arthrobacter crystallopoietes]|nr:MFS transporter [Arthrobacter crystallopoietes]